MKRPLAFPLTSCYTIIVPILNGVIAMKKEFYETPALEFLPLCPCDILTASGPNTDLGPDVGEWDSEM